MSNKSITQNSEDKAVQYLEETRAYVNLLKNDLFNKIMGEEENKKKTFDIRQHINTDLLFSAEG